MIVAISSLVGGIRHHSDGSVNDEEKSQKKGSSPCDRPMIKWLGRMKRPHIGKKTTASDQKIVPDEGDERNHIALQMRASIEEQCTYVENYIVFNNGSPTNSTPDKTT